ncbi:MAG: Cof-type HAD-IIB family hydrolase [Verrucomicrobiota bacterium JB022]|nr:Cof-type HAD-IIB family hydrolase [Verrucomicrobiota bacterium JB022]
MKLQLALIDLDDTLLGPDKRVSRDNLKALRRLEDAGIQPVLASGRHLLSMQRIAAELPGIKWIISMQGGLVTDVAGQNIIFETLLDAEKAGKVIEMGAAAKYTVIVYARDEIFAHRSNEYVQRYERLSGHKVTLLDPVELLKHEIFKVLWLDRTDRIDQILGMVELQELDAYLVRTHNEIFEFMSKSSNKGIAVAELAGHLGIPREACVAFGDGNNDVPMLQWAGQSVAMAHGWEDARKAARLVTPEGGDPSTAFARAVDMVLGE